MPLHKRTISGNVTDTLAYTVETADAYGAQVVDVRFYDGSGNQVTPTGGNYSLQWSANGRDWMNIANPLAASAVKNWQASGYVSSLRAVPDSITGAVSWEVDYRVHGIGDPSGSTFFAGGEDTAFDNGDSYRIDYPFTIPQNGGPLVIKYIVNEPTILTLSTIEIDQGGIEYRIFTEAQATETSPFTDPLTIYPKNLTVSPNPAPVEILDNGAATFTGQQNTTLRIRTASGGGNRNSAVTGESTRRGFGQSIVYAEIARLEGVNVDTIGVLKQEFYRK
jgi:type 1 fimbria pilin